jgi:hypothetical protein
MTTTVMTPSIDRTGQHRLLVEVGGELLGVIHPPTRPYGGRFSWISYACEDTPIMGTTRTEKTAINAIVASAAN